MVSVTCTILSARYAFLLAVICANVAVAAKEHCANGGTFHVLTARVNTSGHWEATLDLEKDSRLFGHAEAMKLDIHPFASLCGDARTVGMALELRGPPPITYEVTTPAPDSGDRIQIPPPELGYTRAPMYPGFYKVHKEREHWRDAKTTCEKERGHLVIINSQEEASALAHLIHQQAQLLTRTLHSGFFATSIDYYSLSGESLSDLHYNKWAEGEPKRADICGAIDHAANLHDAYCSWNVKRSFVCEFGSPPPPTRGTRHVVQPPRPAAPQPEGSPAPDGEYARLPGVGSYKVVVENKTWAEALARCDWAGGRLAVIESEAEASALRQHLAALHAMHALPREWHVGVFAQSHFLTIYGDDLSDSGYQGWAEGEPNNHPCVVAHSDLSLASVGCALKTAFICETENSV